MNSKSMEMEMLDMPKWCEDEAYEAQALGLGDLTPAVLILVVAIVATAVGAYVVYTIGGNLPANTVATNVTNNGQSALNSFSKWFVIIGIVVAAAIILSLLIRSFYGGGGGGGARRG